ncbi:MAG: hypothetical protein BMS9Abin05_2338 [Rhodothermia bacterium]|nr:MAG: hypothetical protein BMS9Abin05_2338 [Rhodothermia bacterium]
MIGKTVSHYQIVSKLGEGGMGVVYKALDTGLDREVALKFLPPSASRDPEAKERFMREAKSASALDHANICTIFEIGETDDGQLFMAMALYDGESLEDRLSEGPMREAEAVDIARQVALGLAAAHEAGIVHRDIKPANVIITSKGVAKVFDFGVAKLGGSAALTQTGASVGTMIYMSPEQARGDDVDARTDIWSLGGVLYEMISGSRPFSTGYDAAILYAILNEDPTPLKDLMPDVSEVVSDIVAKCLSKDKENRFATAENVASALPGEGATVIIERVEVPTRQMNPLVQYGAIAVAGGALIYGAMYWLGLPDWVFPVGLILLLAGFPLLLLSSMFEKKRSVMKTAERTELSGLQKWLTTRRVARGGVLAMSAFGIVTATYMILRALGIGAFATLLTAGILQDDDFIIVAQFENRTDQESLGKTLTTAFKIDLSQSTAITVVERTTEVELLRLMERDPETAITIDLALEMAERQGAKAVIAGELGSVGSGYLLSVRMNSVDDGATIVQLREEAADDTELLATVDRLSRALRKKIGESLRSVRGSPPLAQVTTSSLEALRSFGISLDLQALGKMHESELELSRTVELDSMFAMAWFDYGAAVINQGQDPPRAIEYFLKAYELRGRLSERERLHVTSAYHVFSTRDDDAAVSALQAVIDQYPFDMRALSNLGYVFSSSRRHAEAIELFRRALQLVPNANAYNNLILSLASLGHFEELRAELVELKQNLPDSPVILVAELRSAIAMENYERARLVADSMRSVRDDQLIRLEGLVALSMIHVVRGQLQTARGFLQDLMREQLLEGDSLGANQVGLLGIVTEFAAAGDEESARRSLEEHLRRFPIGSSESEPFPNQLLAELYLDLNEIEAAEASSSLPGLGRPLDEWLPPMNAARIVLVREGADAGIPALIAAYDQNWCDRCGLDLIGLAYDEAGSYPDAIESYERYVSLPDPLAHVFQGIVRVAPVHFRLGELYEETNDIDKAIEHYSQFAELWEKADPELQPQVAEARRRIEALLDRLAREPAN